MLPTILFVWGLDPIPLITAVGRHPCNQQRYQSPTTVRIAMMLRCYFGPSLPSSATDLAGNRKAGVVFGRQAHPKLSRNRVVGRFVRGSVGRAWGSAPAKQRPIHHQSPPFVPHQSLPETAAPRERAPGTKRKEPRDSANPPTAFRRSISWCLLECRTCCRDPGYRYKKFRIALVVHALYAEVLSSGPVTLLTPAYTVIGWYRLH